jgi:translation initiation factor IF-3
MKKDLVSNKQEAAAKRPSPNEGYKVGRDIKASKVRVIGSQGQNLGLMDLELALDQANDQSLELVQIGMNEQENCPTTKIMDFGKFLYEKKKQRNEAKKNQKVIEVKELKFRPNIGDGDYVFRVNRAAEFLKEGKHVKITLQFKGREIASKDILGSGLFDRIVNDVTVKFGTGFDMQKESKGGPFWSKILVPKAT